MAGLISGDEIQKILNSTGPIVKCVLLRAAPKKNDGKPAAGAQDDEDDSKPPAKDNSKSTGGEDDEDSKKPAAKEEEHETAEGFIIETDLIDEVEIDTTPKKSMVEKVLGGPLTFLGQYEDEDLVLICRRPSSLPENTPWNPHLLQPPFDNTKVQGDILIMRVAKEEEKLEHEEDGSDKIKEESASGEDDFFLDFTKDDYIAFAKRDDVEPPEFEEQDEDEEEEEIEGASDDNDDDDDDDEEEDYVVEDDEDGDDDAEAQIGMMNLIMAQVLRRFHEENGRGPDTRELLELRSALAQKLGIDLPEVAAAAEEDEQDDSKPAATGKRSADEENGTTGDADDDHEAKRVKFSQETMEAATGEPKEPQEGEI